MKTYWQIPGPSGAPRGLPCIAFYKHDGSNLRFEWSKKRGWYKFGTRHRLFDESDIEFGEAIPLFLNKFGDEIPKVLKAKQYRGVDRCIVYCEFEGENSFAGWHEVNETQDLILIEVNPHKKGFVPPRQFVSDFGHLHIPKVVYEGNFNREFIQAVRNGEYPVKEGVVAKGIKPGTKAPHGLWMAKAKTAWWLMELRNRAKEIEALRQVLAENEKEQCILGQEELNTANGPG